MADAMDHALHALEQLTLAEALGIYTEGAAFAARAEEAEQKRGGLRRRAGG